MLRQFMDAQGLCVRAVCIVENLRLAASRNETAIWCLGACTIEGTKQPTVMTFSKDVVAMEDFRLYEVQVLCLPEEGELSGGVGDMRGKSEHMSAVGSTRNVIRI